MEPARKTSGLDSLLRSKNFVRIALAAALVMAAAGVILVVSALPSLKDATSKPASTTTAVPLDDYNRGVVAASSGDTATAVAALSAVPESDPNYRAARAKLAELTKPATQSTPSAPSGGGSTATTETTKPSTNPSDAPYLQPIADLLTLLPAAIEGYTVAPPEDQGVIAVTTAEPVRGGADAGKLTLVSYTVHDQKTAAAAKKFVSRVSKKVYAKNGDSSVTIGTRTGYYGTDGRRVATATFARGRYVFEVIATVASSNVNSQKARVIAAAKAFPASQQ
jgi:hypothetical protein